MLFRSYISVSGEFEIVSLTSGTFWTFYIRPDSELDMRFIQTFGNCRRLIKMVFAKKLTGGKHNENAEMHGLVWHIRRLSRFQRQYYCMMIWFVSQSLVMELVQTYRKLH